MRTDIALRCQTSLLSILSTWFSNLQSPFWDLHLTILSSSFARGADSDDIPLAAQSSDLNNNNNNPTSAASQRHRSSTVSRLYAATAPPSDQDLKPSRVPSRTPSDLSREINTIEAESQLDSHVRHVLSSDKKAQLRRMLAGLWVFLKTPMGIVTAIYGFLVVFWGAAIVLFLAGWINAGSKEWQDIWVGEWGFGRSLTCHFDSFAHHWERGKKAWRWRSLIMPAFAVLYNWGDLCSIRKSCTLTPE